MNFFNLIKLLKQKIILLELFFKLRLIFNLLLLNNFLELNLIDTSSFIYKIYSFTNNFNINNLDIDSRILVLSILLLVISIYFTVYMFFFVVSPLLFDAIKDHLPIKLKNFMIKFININRKISVPFVTKSCSYGTLYLVLFVL